MNTEPHVKPKRAYNRKKKNEKISPTIDGIDKDALLIMASHYAKKKMAEEEMIVFKSFAECPVLSFDEYKNWIKSFEDYYAVICLASKGNKELIESALKNDYEELTRITTYNGVLEGKEKEEILKYELKSALLAAISFHETRVEQMIMNKFKTSENHAEIDKAIEYYLKRREQWLKIWKKM